MENRIEILRKFIEDFFVNSTENKNLRIGILNHMNSVSQFCALIALKRGENVELATMAGLLHDYHTYITLDSSNHAEKGSVLAREVLNKLEITTCDETNIICSAIHNHSFKNNTHSSFDEVLIDADVLQHRFYNLTVFVPFMEKEKCRFEKLTKEFGLNTH